MSGLNVLQKGAIWTVLYMSNTLIYMHRMGRHLRCYRTSFQAVYWAELTVLKPQQVHTNVTPLVMRCK
jgi:hypothetical protein